MKRRITWLIVSGLLVAALLLSACGPAVTEKEKAEVEKEEVVVEKKAAEQFVWLDQGGWVRPEFVDDVEEVAPGVFEVWPPGTEEPQYGGTITLCTTSDPRGFDPWANPGSLGYTHEQLTYAHPLTPYEEDPLILIPLSSSRIGWLAESWTQPDPLNITFYLKKGIKFNAGLKAARALVGDREFVADDVVYCWSRYNGLYGFPVSSSDVTRVRYIDEVVALGKYTVNIHSNQIDCQFVNGWNLSCMASGPYYYPREVVDKYGDYNDWRNHVGTGAFILESYIPASSLNYTRNSEYWHTAELMYGVEYTMPFIDGIKVLIIGDTSTQLSALRTGKLDRLDGVEWSQVEGLIKSNPEIFYLESTSTAASSSNYLAIRKDKYPWNLLKVRQAVAMAIDTKALLNDLYRGMAFPLSYPFMLKWDCWMSEEELPREPTVKRMAEPVVGGIAGNTEIVQEDSTVSAYDMYHYDPVRARQLLDEALGKGVEINCEISTRLDHPYLDSTLAVQQYLKAVGINATIKYYESGALTSIVGKWEYPDIAPWTGGQSTPIGTAQRDYWGGIEPLTAFNRALTRDPVFDVMMENITGGAWTEKELTQLLRELNVYYLEVGLRIPLPAFFTYVFWQPWVKGGYWGQSSWCYMTHGSTYSWLWIDQELKTFIKEK